MPFTETDFFNQSLGKKEFILQKNAEQFDKIVEHQTKKYKEELDKQEQLLVKHQRRLEQLKEAGDTEGLQRELAAFNETLLAKERAEKAYLDVKTKAQQQASLAAQKFEEDRFKKMNAKQKREYSKQIADKLKEELEADSTKLKIQSDRIKQLSKIISSTTDAQERESAEKEKAKLQAEQKTLKKNIKTKTAYHKTAEDNATAFSKAELFTSSESRKEAIALKKSSLKESADAAQERKSSAVDKQLAAKEKLAKLNEQWDKEEEARTKKIAQLRREGNPLAEELEAEQQMARERFESSQEYHAAEQEMLQANKEAAEANKEIAEETSKRLAAGAAGLLNDTVDKAINGIDDNINQLFGKQAKYTALLQGTDENWKDVVWDVYSSVGYSGAVSTKKVIEKMENLLDSGVAYNLELRAFLAETSENIAATFDATNGTLLRIIRLQQQDTTAARLGMEATLTKLFNSMFEDTSYLANNISEAVTTAVMDASMTMSRDVSLEFEYALQKWLGALYSLGMSDSGVQTIAQAINYLGTGNITALNSNEAMQTLLAMSATKAGGKSYADMLTEGIDASDTNKLLKAMIEYLAEIAESQSNMVTKSAYAELFGMSITDLSSFASLTSSEINKLYASKTTYSDLVDETQSQLKQILTRKSVVQLVDTALDNALTGVGVTFGTVPALYGTWKALGLLEETVGEIKIPSVLAAGFGIGDLDLLNVAQSAMVGIGLVGSLLGALGSLLDGGATNLNTWDFREHTKRGGGLTLLASGSSSGTSLSAQLAAISASGEDFETVTFEQGEQKGKEEYDKIVSEDLAEEKGVDTEIYEALVDEDEDIISVAQDIRDILESSFGPAGQPVTPPPTEPGEAVTTPGDTSNPYESAQGTVDSSTNMSGASTGNQTLDNIYQLLEKSLVSGNNTLISIIQSLLNSSYNTGNFEPDGYHPSGEITPDNMINDNLLTNETYQDIYSLLSHTLISGNDTLIEAVQSLSSVIDEKLNQERVFYTSIISDSMLPPSTSDKVSELNSQVITGSTVTGTTQETTSTPNNTTTSVTTSTNNGQPLLGSTLSQSSETQAFMEAMIVKAVETAIRNISGYSGGEGVPVYVTNLHTYGG